MPLSLDGRLVRDSVPTRRKKLVESMLTGRVCNGARQRHVHAHSVTAAPGPQLKRLVPLAIRVYETVQAVMLAHHLVGETLWRDSCWGLRCYILTLLTRMYALDVSSCT